MDLTALVSVMTANARRIESLVAGVDEDQSRWKPDARSWSLLEVINHLADEEQEDFRVRLDITVHAPDRPWPPIDPEGWVTARGYNERDLDGSLRRFLEAREGSLAWLRGLQAGSLDGTLDWQASYAAPFGPITAGDLMASWVAHDLLHTRQLVELHWAHAARLVRPYSSRYAGEW